MKRKDTGHHQYDDPYGYEFEDRRDYWDEREDNVTVALLVVSAFLFLGFAIGMAIGYWIWA